MLSAKMSRLLIAIALALPSLAAADPSSWELKDDQLARYKSALADGRKAVRKKDHAAAIAAFGRAIAVIPTGSAALSELGWEEFLTKDFAKAETHTRAALEATGSGQDVRYRDIKAGALYNMGRILEQKGDNKAAAKSYVDSLELRANRVVRERLAKIDPKAAAEADPQRPRAMLGPYKSLAKACADLPDPDNSGDCPSKEHEPTKMAKAKKPWLAAQLFVGGGGMMCFLAAKLAAGWFVDTNGEMCEEVRGLSLETDSFAVEDMVPGGRPELVLRVTSKTDSRGDPDEDGVRASEPSGCEASMIVCGIGESGEPSCMHLQYAAMSECGQDTTSPEWDWELKPVFAGGQLDVRAKGKLDREAKSNIGKRPFVWP
jgi:hypothetical protein